VERVRAEFVAGAGDERRPVRRDPPLVDERDHPAEFVLVAAGDRGPDVVVPDDGGLGRVPGRVVRGRVVPDQWGALVAAVLRASGAGASPAPDTTVGVVTAGPTPAVTRRPS
jgi:hypothetical protein